MTKTIYPRTTEKPKLVFSGHESFPCRYGWMPKLIEAVTTDSSVFKTDERAIVSLGLGKNMVRSIRFWGAVFGVIEFRDKEVVATEFGSRLLEPQHGIDPYLEETGSLWRLHWNVTTQANLGAWSTLFLDVKDVQITRENFIEAVLQKSEGSASMATATAHADMLLKCYDAGRIPTTAFLENALGCPLQELGLLKTAISAGVPIVQISRGPKSGLDVPSFAYSVQDYWLREAPTSGQLSLRSLMFSRRGPGSVFRLDEASLHERLTALCESVPELSLSDDGAGGIDLVASKKTGPKLLEDLIW